jgi:hypothetical protein
MIAADPHEQFERWMADVIELGLPEPTAWCCDRLGAGQPRAGPAVRAMTRTASGSSRTGRRERAPT